MSLGLAELLHQPLGCAAESLYRAQQRRLHIERRAGVGAEGGRNAQCGTVLVTLDERGRSRIPSSVATRLECRAQPAGWKRRGVRLSANKIFTRKPVDRHGYTGGFEKRIVFFGGAAGHRLKPVGEMGGAQTESPRLHTLGYLVGD